MPLEQFNTGHSANDGTGEKLRDAFLKVGRNFQYLDSEKIGKQPGKGLSTNDFTTALKTVLEFISATKAFDADVVQDNLAAEILRTKGISWTPGVPASPDENLKHDHIAVSADIVVEGGQTIPNDPAIIDKDNRLITVKNAFEIERALKQFIEQHFMPMLDKDNPTMKMHVSPAGTAAQMQVIDDDTGHDVATMNWNKTTKSFSFMLSDPATGVQKASFEIKLDGNAYIDGKKIATSKNAMTVKGVITKVVDIVDTGIYYGTDIQGAPVHGKAMIMASKDSDGNLGFFFMGEDQLLRTGGRHKGSHDTVWYSVQYKRKHTLMVGAHRPFSNLDDALKYISEAGYGSYTIKLAVGETFSISKPPPEIHGDLEFTSEDTHSTNLPIVKINTFCTITFNTTWARLKLVIDASRGHYFHTTGYFKLYTSAELELHSPARANEGKLRVTGADLIFGFTTKVTIIDAVKHPPIEVYDGRLLLDSQDDTHFKANVPHAESTLFLLGGRASAIIEQVVNRIHPKPINIEGFEYLLSCTSPSVFVEVRDKINLIGTAMKGLRKPTDLGRVLYAKNKVGSALLATDHGIGYPLDGIYKNGGTQLDISANHDIKFLLSDGTVSLDKNYAAQNDQDIATVKTIREFRTTIEHNIANHAKPTLAECKTVFKMLPHYDWTKDDDFYIKDSTGGKIVLIKYRATPAATEASPGNFFYEVLTPAV